MENITYVFEREPGFGLSRVPNSPEEIWGQWAGEKCGILIQKEEENIRAHDKRELSLGERTAEFCNIAWFRLILRLPTTGEGFYI